MRKISIYTKTGEQAATSYYRIYQYIYNIKADYRFRKMISDGLYKKIMPISSKNIIIKVLIFIYIYFRVLVQLVEDTINVPDIIIVSRRFINRTLPWSYKRLLRRLKKKGTNIIWDFDDNIIESKEVSKTGFNFLAKISDHIIIASLENKNLIPQKYHKKVKYLPTTDGDMYKYATDELRLSRKKLLDHEIRLIWIGTSVSLKYVEEIIEYLNDYAAKMIGFKKVTLTVVCDKPLSSKKDQALAIRNIKWERDVTIRELLNSHIGLMPLDDSVFNRGKGGFKLIQYLSLALPVIGSPIGINTSIINDDVGFLANTTDSRKWKDAIDFICKSEDKWEEFSKNAFSEWEKNYNFNSNFEVWENILFNNKKSMMD